MKKNGFIMSTYVYILLVFFLLLLGTMLVVLNNTRLLANKIKENTDGNIDFNLILKGDKEIILKKDSEYIEPGYIATTFDGKKLDVNVMGEVNVNKLGEYDIIYIAEYKGVEKKIRRKVIVAENVAENLVTYITNLYNNEETRIENGLKKDNTPDENMRYYGSNPNNYVSFNNELWRIIGVFGNNVKLVRKDSLGKLSWDSSASGINRGLGINQWGESKNAHGNEYAGADLKNYLNTMYYGGTNVTCYGIDNNGTTTCPTNKLNTESKTLIDKHTWNTGAIEWGKRTDTLAFYSAERGTKIIEICYGIDNDYCDDMIVRTTEWTGYVALPYVTDWAYASSESVCETNMQKQDSSNNFICKNNNWMQRSTMAWYLSPQYGQGSNVFVVVDKGNLGTGYAYASLSVFPTIYLKSNVLIESGNGTSSNPYILKAGS